MSYAKNMKQTRKILIIDDDEQLCQLLQDIFESEGFTVQTENSVIFTKKIAEYNPDLILLDMWFDQSQKGILLHQALEQQAQAQNKVIMMSSDSQLQRIAHKYNIQRFIQKPFDIEQLLSIIKGVLFRPKLA